MSVGLSASRIYQFHAVNPKHNQYMLDRIRFVPFMRRLTVAFAYNTLTSEGVQDFVTTMLPTLQANNEHIEFVVMRGNHGCKAVIRATYEYNRGYSRTIDFRTPHQILAIVEEFSIGGDFRVNRCVGRRIARDLDQVDNQPGHKGHQPFKVHSRWDQLHAHGVSETDVKTVPRLA